jgi:hypothetical protein
MICADNAMPQSPGASGLAYLEIVSWLADHAYSRGLLFRWPEQNVRQARGLALLLLKCAFIPAYSGGTAADSHRIPFFRYM